jgi:hypothetical protein
VHYTATGKLWRPDRALSRPAGALLPVGLAAAAGDLATGLGVMAALSSGRLLSYHHLVHQWDVDLDVEDVGRKINGAGLGAVGVPHVKLGHWSAPFGVFVDLAALRMTTSAPFGPGTAPLIRINPRSVSTA